MSTRPTRTLTTAEADVIRELYAARARLDNTHAYVTTTAPLTLTRWNGRHPVEQNETKVEIPVGSTLKIVMVSRFNDCGLTDDLSAINGYGLRLFWEDAALTDIRRTAERTITLQSTTGWGLYRPNGTLFEYYGSGEMTKQWEDDLLANAWEEIRPSDDYSAGIPMPRATIEARRLGYRIVEVTITPTLKGSP